MYEKGLLHPFLDYETPAPWLNTLDDPLDGEGNVRVSALPGPGRGHQLGLHPRARRRLR